MSTPIRPLRAARAELGAEIAAALKVADELVVGTRSATALIEPKDDFKKGHPCPSTGKTSGSCPGYVIDHVEPLKRGGADDPSNMQWQTAADAKAKDKVE